MQKLPSPPPLPSFRDAPFMPHCFPDVKAMVLALSPSENWRLLLRTLLSLVAHHLALGVHSGTWKRLNGTCLPKDTPLPVSLISP